MCSFINSTNIYFLLYIRHYSRQGDHWCVNRTITSPFMEFMFYCSRIVAFCYSLIGIIPQLDLSLYLHTHITCLYKDRLTFISSVSYSSLLFRSRNWDLEEQNKLFRFTESESRRVRTEVQVHLLPRRCSPSSAEVIRSDPTTPPTGAAMIRSWLVLSFFISVALAPQTFFKGVLETLTSVLQWAQQSPTVGAVINRDANCQLTRKTPAS